MYYPDWISPVLFWIGPFALRWYSLAYVTGFLLGYWMLKTLFKEKHLKMPEEHYESLWSGVIIGIIVGARLGHILLYEPLFYLQNPLKIFAIWEGGMAFHGGLLGVIISLLYFCKKYTYSFFEIADAAVLPTAIGQGIGRLANFANAELYGKVTSLPWAIRFPLDPLSIPREFTEPRHPAQLYEFVQLICLFILLWVIRKYAWKKHVGFLGSLYLILHGFLRFWVEFYHESGKDLLWGILTQAQIYALLSVIIGIIIMSYTQVHQQKYLQKRKDTNDHTPSH